MKFASDKSHVRRLTKAEAKERGIAPSRETYVVRKTYRDPFENKVYRKGEVISNRQGRNVQSQEQGNYKSYAQYNRIWSPNARQSDEQVRKRNAMIRQTAKHTGRTPEQVRKDPKFRRAYTDFQILAKGSHRNKGPKSPLANYLVAAGLRTPNASYNVGDTPRRGGKR